VLEREAKNDAREKRIIEIANLKLARHVAFESDEYRLARRKRARRKKEREREREKEISSPD